MTRQYINIGDKWAVVVYHGASAADAKEITNALEGVHCSHEDIEQAIDVIKGKNTGFTFSFPESRMSVVAISQSTSKAEYLNTIAHESKHVLSAIAKHYGMDESGEDAAYLIGNLVMEMVQWVN